MILKKMFMIQYCTSAMNRRRLIAHGTVLLPALFAGCSRFQRVIRGRRLAHNVTILNIIGSPLRLEVRVKSATDDVLLNEHATIAYDHGWTSRPFRGRPTAIQISFDESTRWETDIEEEEQWERKWPRPPHGECTDTTRSTATITFKKDKTYVQGNCETITTQ
jgi:hypothetical protein